MRVVLDTNVLISGTFWTGDSFKILQLIEKGKLTLILSKEILQEYDRIVHSDEILEKSAYQQERMAAVYKIAQQAVMVEPKERFKIIREDPDDDKFLEAAIAGKAGFIISQDKRHLLPLKEFRGIGIIMPAEFLAHLRN